MVENSAKHMIVGLAGKALVLTTALALAYFVASEEPQPQCGIQAGSRELECSDRSCCSWVGFCGKDMDHCGFGCQSNCRLGTPEECGVQAGGAVCSDGRCCSGFGFCGLGTEYCGPSCQSNCRGGR